LTRKEPIPLRYLPIRPIGRWETPQNSTRWIRLAWAAVLVLLPLLLAPSPGEAAEPLAPNPDLTAPASPSPDLLLEDTGEATDDQVVLSLEAAVGQAVRQNPGLAEVSEQARALSFVPSQVGTLPDPQVSFTSQNLPVDSFDTTQENMTQMKFGVSQTVPFPGKLGFRETAARHAASAASSDVEEFRLKLIREVKRGWWQTFYLDRAIEIVRRNQELLRQFTEIAQTKYEVGEGLQQDVLLSQVELSRLLDQEIRLKGLRRGSEARLNALLGRPRDASITLPQRVRDELRETSLEPQLKERAEANRPLLRSARERIEAARARKDLAKRDFFPDFTLGAAYGLRGDANTIGGPDRADFLTLGIGVSVPIFAEWKQQQALDQRRAELLQQRNALEDDRLRVRKEVEEAGADYRSAREQAALLKTGIIPQAAQSVASMRAGYLVNQVDFLNLVRAQITLLDFETKYWKALSEANQALASLTASVGGEVFDEDK
jgi:outer membrane protein TolC